MDPDRKAVIRSILIFCLFIFIPPWMMWFLLKAQPSEEMRNLGQLVFILMPLVGALLARIGLKHGWKDLGFAPKFKGNGTWYALALWLYLPVIGLALLLGKVFGVTGFHALAPGKDLGALLFAGMAANFVKNIFEETGWRGFLTPKVFGLNQNPWISHLIVGLIWGLWHVPYYLGFLNPATLANYTKMPLVLFIPLVVIGIMAASVCFTELRLLTGSIWPPVLLHTVYNTVTGILILEKMVTIRRPMECLFSPGMESLLSMALILPVGIILHRIRIKR